MHGANQYTQVHREHGVPRVNQYTQAHGKPRVHGVPRVPGSVCKYFFIVHKIKMQGFILKYAMRFALQ